MVEVITTTKYLPACTVQGGCLLRGVLGARGGGLVWGSVCSWGGGIPACTWAVPPPLPPRCTEFLTHATENITLPKLRLRAVINAHVNILSPSNGSVVAQTFIKARDSCQQIRIFLDDVISLLAVGLTLREVCNQPGSVIAP